MDKGNEFYTVEEAARVLGTTKGNIMRQIREDELEAEREGRRWKVPAHLVHERLMPFYHVPRSVEEDPDDVQNLDAERNALAQELSETRSRMEAAERMQDKLLEERDNLLRQLGEVREKQRSLEQELEQSRRRWRWLPSLRRRRI